MKKYLKTVLVVAFSSLLFTNCSKDDDSTPSPNYSPTSNGSNWTYSSTEGTNTSTTYTLTATSKDTVVNNRTYKVFTNSSGPNNYMAKQGNNYYRLASYPNLGINNFEDVYLMDNKAVNETWASTATFTYANVPFTANLTYTVKEKGINRTVATKSYSNVIHVRLDIAVAGFGPMGGGDFYYAEGVGMTDALISITPPPITGIPTYNIKQELTSYQIK